MVRELSDLSNIMRIIMPLLDSSVDAKPQYVQILWSESQIRKPKCEVVANRKTHILRLRHYKSVIYIVVDILYPTVGSVLDFKVFSGDVSPRT